METTTLFLAGDVMTGRGLDQALKHPGSPALHEPSVRDARRYVELAEAAHGSIPIPLAPAYPWGDAIAVLDEARPDARIINLETSVTTSGSWCRGKEIHYRMHPANVDCLTAAAIDVATLANNHTLDWGREGLVETLDTLHRAGIRTAGAGRTLAEAEQPAIVDLRGGGRAPGRILVWSVGSATSGIPLDWQATDHGSGLALVDAIDARAAESLAARVAAGKRPGDIAVVSIHWGTNWGFEVPEEFVRFAHRLIDGGCDLVHGHSSHHVRPIEVYRDRLILYGCGDLLDDYEGITGHAAYRSDLGLMYFPTLDVATGRLVGMQMVPLQMRRFRLGRAADEGLHWLADALSRISRPFHTSVEIEPQGRLAVRW
ncbi:MAG: CapA family protein [Planctomycetia bacterium]